MDDLIGKPKVQQWEYVTVYPKEKTTMIHETLNSYGELGWELCEVIEHKEGGVIYIFKRPKTLSHEQ